MTTQAKPRASRWVSALLLLALLLIGVALTVVLDEKVLVSHAYSVPMMLFRSATYGLLFMKAKKRHLAPIAVVAVFNELFIFLTWSGAITLW
ncbi:hypothetical protein VII00023_19955 [Vibrio ichthyoenteri ATCC 700023]|uniref:Uncharacterized protein n=1 Tax=Vibrio ichthyoenteri ATCC 700023 TaxID=870968 RepID=F9S336_9VIBR|nr:hypothetical protein [Vibrio ichthyoenteri]EGU38354.1 hypothetical protein VII00023_19955 [Vibrio ichthyoenteri ATCC 700023]